MFSKMRMAFVLLFIGVCNGSPRSNWDDFDRRMDAMGERLDRMGERMEKDSDMFLGDSSSFMKNSRERMHADQEKQREQRQREREMREKEREKGREQRQREREIREKKREERQKKWEEGRKKWAAEREERAREREAYWKNFNSEMDEKFKNKPEEGVYISSNSFNGGENVLIENGNSRTHTIKKILANGEMYYRQTNDQTINGVVHRTVTVYNPQTKKYNVTKYTKNTNDPNAKFVKV